MPITQTNTASNESDTGVTSLAVTKPVSNMNDGDLMVAVASVGAAQTFSSGGPSGWTLIGSSVTTTGVTTSAWYKIAASEPSTWTWNFSGSTAATIAISMYRGANQGAPINVNAEAHGSGTTQTQTSPSVTTTLDGCWVIYTRTTRDDTNSKPNVASTVTSPAIERVDEQFSASAGVSHGVVIADSNGSVSAGSQTGAQIAVGTTTPTDSILRTIAINSADVLAPAALASAAATANDATIQIGIFAPAGVATATAVVNQTSVNPAGVATVTASALDAVVSIKVSAESPGASASASGAGAYFAAPPGRTVMVGAEIRAYRPDSESRTFQVTIGGVDA